MTHTTTHVRENGTATLVCPACNTVRHIAAERFRAGRHTMAVRCRCGHVFNILLDFRNHYRKIISLTGTYEILSGDGYGGGLVNINNISREGLGFSISGLHQIKIGQELSLEFRLNDKKSSPIKKTVVVVAVRGNTIGCRFKDAKELDKALGFYLQS